MAHGAPRVSTNRQRLSTLRPQRARVSGLFSLRRSPFRHRALPNENSPTGVLYYMAFGGGNADYSRQIYWAVSDDVKRWTRIAQRHRFRASCHLFDVPRSDASPRSAPPCSAPSGRTGAAGVENYRFYVFFITGSHPPECTEGHDSPACVASTTGYYRALSPSLRFVTTPTPLRFGGAVRESIRRPMATHRETRLGLRRRPRRLTPADSANPC